jgi:hypothetical protein
VTAMIIIDHLHVDAVQSRRGFRSEPWGQIDHEIVSFAKNYISIVTVPHFPRKYLVRFGGAEL